MPVAREKMARRAAQCLLQQELRITRLPVDPIVVAGPASDAGPAAGVIVSGITVGAVTGIGATGTLGAAAVDARGRGGAGVGLGVPRAGGGGSLVGMKETISLGA